MRTDAMKLFRTTLALTAAAVLVGVAYVGQAKQTAGMQMAVSARKFVDSLKPEQREKAMFAFDSKERTRWHFTPQQDDKKRYTRKGLPMEEMTEEQKQAALALLKAGTSEGEKGGYIKATTIMSLEGILAELEQGGAMVRKPGWYFFTIFGDPSKDGKWGWRVEGHHLSLNFTLDGGKVVASTPAFFGANPATVKQGARKGLRTLAEAEDIAKDLFRSLDDDQRTVALQQKLLEDAEIGESKASVSPGPAKGLPAEKMNEKQKAMLDDLLKSYAHRMPPDIAENELAQVKQAGLNKVYFAYAGGLEPGQPHTYRIQGPTFVVMFLNVQADSAKNPANHIHSAWRNIKGDFGLTE
jgi:hypothetical protein